MHRDVAAGLKEACERGGPTQRRVRATIAGVGGYWRPLAALARLMEELGEFAEAAPGSGDTSELRSELADLWIISTALADQFLAEVEEPGSHPALKRAGAGSLRELISSAGVISRIVNYYDGPKTPRSVDRLPSLSDAVAEFHAALEAAAAASHLDLAAAVHSKLDLIALRDAGRFPDVALDPSTAPVIAAFRSLDGSRFGLGPSARLWGAPKWSGRSVALNVQAILTGLVAFTRAASRERLDAYVMSGPRLSSEERLTRWLRSVLAELSRHDPTGSSTAQSCSPDLEGGLTFNRTRLELVLFAPVYAEGDPRHSPFGTFVVARPTGQARPLC
jgi:hypothetical protein